MPRDSTAIIGPMLQSPVIPNESSRFPDEIFAAETPAPMDIIKGTVMGPVVTPPESNANGKNDGETKNAITNAPI